VSNMHCFIDIAVI